MPNASEKSSEKPAAVPQKDIEGPNGTESLEDWVILAITPSVEEAATGDDKLTTNENGAINSYLKEFDIPKN